MTELNLENWQWWVRSWSNLFLKQFWWAFIMTQMTLKFLMCPSISLYSRALQTHLPALLQETLVIKLLNRCVSCSLTTSLMSSIINFRNMLNFKFLFLFYCLFNIISIAVNIYCNRNYIEKKNTKKKTQASCSCCWASKLTIPLQGIQAEFKIFVEPCL